MSEALPGKTNDPITPAAEARPLQGKAPVWDPVTESQDEGSRFAEQAGGESHGLAAERGGSAMTGTAERIGAVVGTAQREVRRRLELVRNPGRVIPLTGASQAEQDVDRGTMMMDEIEQDVADLRRQAADRLDEWSEVAQERFQELRQQARAALARSRERAQTLADTYPLQTIAAIAGVGFVIGIALRMSRRPKRG